VGEKRHREKNFNPTAVATLESTWINPRGGEHQPGRERTVSPTAQQRRAGPLRSKAQREKGTSKKKAENVAGRKKKKEIARNVLQLTQKKRPLWDRQESQQTKRKTRRGRRNKLLRTGARGRGEHTRGNGKRWGGRTTQRKKSRPSKGEEGTLCETRRVRKWVKNRSGEKARRWGGEGTQEGPESRETTTKLGMKGG